MATIASRQHVRCAIGSGVLSRRKFIVQYCRAHVLHLDVRPFGLRHCFCVGCIWMTSNSGLPGSPGSPSRKRVLEPLCRLVLLLVSARRSAGDCNERDVGPRDAIVDLKNSHSLPHCITLVILRVQPQVLMSFSLSREFAQSKPLQVNALGLPQPQVLSVTYRYREVTYPSI